MAVRAVPEGCNTVNAYLIVPSCEKALEFYGKAFGAETIMRMPGPDGKSTMHAEMRLGNSMVMLTDENPAWGCRAPSSYGGTPVSLHLYVENADALFDRAVQAGCTAQMPMQTMFWGDRFGKLSDPFGHNWSIATHVEDVPPDEMGRRMEAAFAEMGKGGQCS